VAPTRSGVASIRPTRPSRPQYLPPRRVPVIYVCAGTYNESLSISEPLDLDGAQFGRDARGRVTAETVIDGAGGITYTTGATTGTINGFTLNGYTGSVAEIVASNVGSGWTFNNNIIDVSNGGIYVNTAGVSDPSPTKIQTNSFVQSVPSAANSGDYGQAVLIWANTANNVTIANNDFTDLSGPGAAINTSGTSSCGATLDTTNFSQALVIQKNAFTDSGTAFANDSGSWFIDENFLALFCTTNAKVVSNTVTIEDPGDANAETPIYLGGGDWATTVSLNTLTGNGASGASGVNFNSDFYAAGTGAMITNNTVSGFLYGIHVRPGVYGAPFPGAGNIPSYFTITGNAVSGSLSNGIAIDAGLYGKISGNTVSGSANYDCYDGSGPGGTGTSGTYNTWSGGGSTSSPSGLCH